MIRTLLSALLVAVLGNTSFATPTINVGNFFLQPNLAGQQIKIFVTGGDLVDALDFAAQIADGGPGPVTMGVINGPDITAADIVTGTAFNGSVGVDAGSLPQVVARFVLANNPPVPATGLLATLTIDTTGFFGGTYELRLKNTRAGDTLYSATSAAGQIPTNVTNGSITVVPEPSTFCLAFAAACALFGVGRCTRHER